MAISSANALNEIAAGLATNADRFLIDKASIATQIVGGYSSLWRATGIPAQGAIPGAAAVCTKALTGAVSFNNQTAPMTSYLAWAYCACSSVGQGVEVYDRLMHMGGLSGTVTTAQTVNVDASNAGISADRRGETNFSDLQWFLEWYTSTGSTGVNATCAVTYDDNSTGNVVVAVPASTAASRMLPILPAVGGRRIKSIQSVTLSATTGTAGSFGVTAARQRTVFRTDISNKSTEYTWAQLGNPEIPSDACLFFVVLAIATSTGTVRGGGKIIHV
jgi:hypothetical protein